MRRCVIILLTLIITAFVVPSSVLACTCTQSSLRDELDQTDAVFIGKVVRLEVTGESLGINAISVDVEFKSSIKGEQPRIARFTTSDGCCACEFSFEIGKTYLLSATRAEEGFSTSTCSRSKIIATAADDLRELGVTWPSK